MTPKERAAMQQALEALDSYEFRYGSAAKDVKAITALREALAEQAEQEPVAWMNDSAPMGVFARNKEGAENFGCTIPLYAAPVRTKDLTYAELGELFVKAKEETFGYARVKPEGGISLKPSIEYFARAVIAADREKNNPLTKSNKGE